ncbi:crotonase/enoyl-CoA hydratase family protein [Pseudoroseomonas cervicalis]|uniref:Enoyl-CoA hydratase/isomerase family protein n=1 Tax=Pseudoroseomonas cervicalis ATCC 49957 TaxID=525371 RepID=D5RRC0_9PROT|nr:crotonase/enoyl-CoA hydratase family protein [Pseudoroseomonas cervicalis]EFH10144.1 enoyl-CoA hydratase/isomerase family protein [Pseudoroseomonas cervicalis ATCC 49957]
MYLDRPTAAQDLPASRQGSLAAGFDNLTLRLEEDSRSLWCHMAPAGKPSYTMALMQDVHAMQHHVAARFAASAAPPADWFVMASAVPGIYNLGGDLAHFAQRIRARDHAALVRYGHVAVEAIHRNHIAFGLPMVTLALVQGDALGGGFEHALSFDMIVAERSAKLGLPEVLFNMFPGMGAYSFLSRRIDRRRAEALISSGRIHSAEELHEMGVVDILAEDGEGEAVARDYILRQSRKHNALLTMLRARRRVNPVTLEELRDVVEMWAAAAMNLGEADLKKMDRLVAAQDRRLAAPASPGYATAAE